jgi:hypothetical protein
MLSVLLNSLDLFSLADMEVTEQATAPTAVELQQQQTESTMPDIAQGKTTAITAVDTSVSDPHGLYADPDPDF